MVLTKTIEMPEELFNLAVNEFDCKWANRQVTIKRFLHGDTAEIGRESTKIKMMPNATFTADVNPFEVQDRTILKGVVSAPWQVNDLSTINSLPPMVADWVLNELNSFNTIEYKKKEV